MLPYDMAQYNKLVQKIQELNKKIKTQEGRSVFCRGEALLDPDFAASAHEEN